ncbi:MAG: DUF4097 family beta strand repeat-containing protein [candidate division Zixibacteria bacterium]|nr:DUF4097 family beta strand repeat-containing protein [candidate division Zixibacteria bacterium]
MNDEVEIRIVKRVKGRREDRARSAFEEIEVFLSRRDDDVHIRIVDNNESIFLRSRVTVEMTARVPERYSLDLSTVDGNIEIENMKSPVTAIAEDGTIDIRHVTGDVIARTTDGDIQIRDTQSAVKVDAGDGNIETWSTEGRVEASTLEGDIGLFKALGAVTAKTLRGNIDVEVARTNRDSDSRGKSKRTVPPVSNTPETPEPTVADPPEARPSLDTRCDLDTNEGDVTIYLPDDLAATIEAEGSSGGLVLSRLWRDDVGHIYSDFGLNKSEWGVFFYIQSEAFDDINGGGDRFRLNTSSGNIHIKKKRH